MPNNLQEVQNIHMVGIGGSGMSALAMILKEMGKNITGSDIQETETIQKLTEQGIPVHIAKAALPPNTQALIYSQAVSLEDPQRKMAEQQGIPSYSYPQAVGFLTEENFTIAVCGTHGKTTTTAMIAATFLENEKDPTVIVGAAGKSRLGKEPLFIVEACEYQKSFLNYRPNIIVITNMELDHVDAFPTFESYKEAFREFLNLLPEKEATSEGKAGVIVANGDDPEVVKLCEEFQKENPTIEVLLFGHATERHFRVTEGHLWEGGQDRGELKLKIPGNHNKLNALAAYTAAVTEGLDPEKTVKALQEYQGAPRRFETIGKIGDCVVIDDYAHHPTEIEAVLGAAREKFGKDTSILCVFQPHQYSRTAKLLDKFAAAFNQADEVIISDIYAARDTQEDKESVNAEKLAEAINHYRQTGQNTSESAAPDFLVAHSSLFAYDGGGKDETIKTVLEKAPDFNIIIFMGAGTITNYAHEAVGKGSA